MTAKQSRIVVIGAGYAGLLAAIRLAGKTRSSNVQITLVNGSDVFVERVRLHQFAASATFKQRRIIDILRGTRVNFQQGVVTGIDTTRREVTVKTPSSNLELGYDFMIYALGSTIERDSVPGLHEYAYTLTPNGPRSAVALRESLPSLNEAHGRAVIVGAGATGVESAAEFAKSYPGLQVRLLTRGEFGQFLGKRVADYMRQSLTRLGVTIQDHTVVTEVSAEAVVTAGGARVPYDVCLWTGGFGVPTLAREAGLTVNELGQILVDPYMRSISHPEIYAVGDAAQPVEDPGVRMRMSAFTAVITGAHGADCLSNMLRGKAARPLSFAYVGQGIALGHHNAIGFNNYPNDEPNRPYFTGRAGYEVREFFVKFLAALPIMEKRWPGFFFWIGKGRYAAAKVKTQRPARPEQEHALQ